MSNLVQLNQEGSILTMTLNRPERHNSLIPLLLEELIEGIEKIAGSNQARAVILNARGSSFSTGGDILEFYKNRQDLAAYSKRLVGLLNKAIIGLYELSVPVVAAVQGIVTGGSIGLILAADVILLTQQASFTPYYGVLGFSPDGGWTALLPHFIGVKRTAEVLMCNRTITAGEAVTWGLASRIVTEDQLHDESRRTAVEISNLVPGSINLTKALLRSIPGDVKSRLQEEQMNFVVQIQSDEAMIGIEKFLKIN